MRAHEKHIGKTYGRLTVLAKCEERSGEKRVYMRCMCSCGNLISTRVDGIVSGHATSCGCYGAEQRKKANTTHDRSRTITYASWEHMVARCNNPSNDRYARYGKLGMHQPWMDFEQFYADMGDRPSSKYSIERKDNDVGYFPWNCKWATYHEQSRNTSRTRFFEIGGVTMCLKDWCNASVASYKRALKRLLLGHSIEKALDPNKWN